MRSFVIRTIALAAALYAQSLWAQLPQKFNYQAVVRGNAGAVIANKPLGMRFTIRDGSASGAAQYSETQLTTTNSYGLVNLQVGAGTVAAGSFATISWSAGNKFLQVEVDTTGSANYVNLATVELITVPYAITANTAISANTAKRADSATVALTAATADSAVKAGAATTAHIADSAGKLAAGQAVKSFNGLTGAVTLTATGGNSLSVTGNQVVLSANYGGDGGASTFSRSDHTHAGQFWTTSSGNTLTLQTNSASFNSSALEADVANTTSQAAAIFAQTLSTNSNSAGVVGQATGNGSAAGLLGIGLGAGTYAVLGSAQGTGSYAGVFSGNVAVTGTLSKSAGSFKIDHPLDPANKFLYHSFVESPDMMNIYNGNITLDAHGGATVVLPDWFEALNKDFRYQLTALGKPSPNLYIAEEITGNRFRIAGGTPAARVSWTVTGIRHDAYANAHRLKVEEEKPAKQRGKYLHPDLFGQPASQAIFQAPNVQPHSKPQTPSR
jgi:hypothetical protein